MILTLQQIENLRPRRHAGPDSRVQFRKRQEVLRSLVLDIARENAVPSQCADMWGEWAGERCARMAMEDVRNG